MVCPICNATTHKKFNCPIKYEYSALLYKYVIDTYINWGQLTVLLSNAAYSLSQMTNMEIDLLGEFIVDKKQYHTPLWKSNIKWERCIPNGMTEPYRTLILPSIKTTNPNYKKELICHFIVNNRYQNLLTKHDKNVIRKGNLEPHICDRLSRIDNYSNFPLLNTVFRNASNDSFPPADFPLFNTVFRNTSNDSFPPADFPIYYIPDITLDIPAHSTCPVCYEILTVHNTTQLQCSHQICFHCLCNQLVKFKNVAENATASCCLCRQTIHSLEFSCHNMYSAFNIACYLYK